MTDVEVRYELNGSARHETVPAQRLVVDHLRDEVGLTGTKLGCGVGVCGACSVLVDGALVSGCLYPAVFADGATVTTIEGIARDGELAPLQEAFITEGGFQCGICTPGQIVSASALLASDRHPTDGAIREWMMGNICRCTGYEGIRRAIRKASGA